MPIDNYTEDFYRLHQIDFPPGTPVEVRPPHYDYASGKHNYKREQECYYGIVHSPKMDSRYVIIEDKHGAFHTEHRTNVFGVPKDDRAVHPVGQGFTG